VSKYAWKAVVRQSVSVHWLVVFYVSPCGLRLLVRGWYLCMSFVRYSVKLSDGLWAWCWWWSQSYPFEEIGMGEAVAIEGMRIPILRVPILFHDVYGDTMAVYTYVL